MRIKEVKSWKFLTFSQKFFLLMLVLLHSGKFIMPIYAQFVRKHKNTAQLTSRPVSANLLFANVTKITLSDLNLRSNNFDYAFLNIWFFAGCKNPTTSLNSLKIQYLSLQSPPTPLEGTVWFLQCKTGYIWDDFTYVKNITCSQLLWSQLPSSCIGTNLPNLEILLFSRKFSFPQN